MRALPAVGTPCPVRTSRHPCPERHTEPHRHESTQRETHIVNVGRRLMLASDATRHTHHRHYAIDKDTEGSTHTQATVSTRQYEMAWSATRGPGSREECTTTHVRDREQVGRRHQELGLALLLCCHGTAACHDTEEPHLALSLTSMPACLPACLSARGWWIKVANEEPVRRVSCSRVRVRARRAASE